MTPDRDELREKVKAVLMEGRGCRPDLAYCVRSGHPCDCGDDADAVLAVLPQYEQEGARWHNGKMVATYIVREAEG